MSTVVKINGVDLPLGWSLVGVTPRGSYYRATIAGVGHIDVDQDGVAMVSYLDEIESPTLVRAFAFRLIEASEIVERIRRNVPC